VPNTVEYVVDDAAVILEEINRTTRKETNAQEFYSRAKIEKEFSNAFTESNITEMSYPVIDAQFELIMKINKIDSAVVDTFIENYPVIDKPQPRVCQDANSFVRSLEAVDDHIETMHSNKEGTVEDTEHSSTSREEVVIDYVNNVKTRDVDILKSLKSLPPIPEETDTGSDISMHEQVSSLVNLRGLGKTRNDSYEYALESNQLEISSQDDFEQTSQDESQEEEKSKDSQDETAESQEEGSSFSPGMSNLVRYTSTPHLQRVGESSPRDDNLKSGSKPKSDSGFNESGLSLPVTCLADVGTATKDSPTTAVSDFATEGSSDPTEVSCSSSQDSQMKETKCLVEENLEAFLTFTGFPAEHKSLIIDKFMKSGLATL